MSNVKCQIKNLLEYWYLLVVLVFIGSILARSAGALTMSNDNYILQMGNFNMSSGKAAGDNYKMGVTTGQTAPGLFSGDNYKVRSGFQYIHSIIPFAFTITNTTIDFGTLTANEPVTRTSNLTISNGSANGYSVTASENHQLLVPASGAVIPDTTCDDGSCTETTSAAWSNSLTYGFGYRCDNVSGTDCATGFTTSTFYKQFDASPSAKTVMTGANVGRDKEVQITYKVNISTTQAAGLYNNIIMYIATPTF